MSNRKENNIKEDKKTLFFSNEADLKSKLDKIDLQLLDKISTNTDTKLTATKDGMPEPMDCGNVWVKVSWTKATC